MKKLSLTLLSLIIVFSSVLAQKTNDGGGTTPGNNNNNDESKNNTNNNSCMSSVFEIGSVLAGSYHKKLLSSSKKNPSVTSFELAVLGGYATSVDNLSNVDYYNLIPRLKLNWGAFSGDVRYNSMMWVDDVKIGSEAFDGLVEFNFIPNSMFKLAIGQGIMYQLDTKKAYHESLLAADLAINKRQIIISPEGRFVYDWANSMPVYYELALTGGYRILKFNAFNIFANLGASYRNYNNISQYAIVFGGLNFVIQ